MIVTAIGLVATAGITALFLLAKAFFMARWPVGWLLMFANTVYDTFYKKFGWLRWHVDAVLYVAAVVGWAVFAGPVAGVVAAGGCALAWATTQRIDLEWRNGRLARQHSGWKGRAPLPVPELIVHVRGPVMRRSADGVRCELGAWPVGTSARFDVVVLNPSVVRPQLPLVISVVGGPGGLELATNAAEHTRCPEPGEVVIAGVEVTAEREGGSDAVDVIVEHGDRRWPFRLEVSAIVDGAAATARGASITRWKYGADAAFAWRGDHDLYDPATFQSEEGLRKTLGLSARFRLPSTLFMSGRLSLVEEEHQRFCDHHGWDRRSSEIPSFVEFMRNEVDLTAEQDWPYSSDRPFSAELGNHMYLHYGTHAAADEGNDWTSHARAGAGTYSWSTSDDRSDTLTEQRDNAAKNNAVVAELLGAEQVSYAIPSDFFDAHTPAAVEAAGIEVGSDTDASRFVRVMRLPPPHHPKGTTRLVELTRKYPKDPDDAYRTATLKYWAHFALRTGRAFTLLSHHHLLWYEGSACYHLTEELLRYVLADCGGAFYVATMAAIGRYWRDVLSPTAACVTVDTAAGVVTVRNDGERDLTALPVELQLPGGRSYMVLVDVAAGETAQVTG